jgi:protein-S-isoprenylcysteine O-methyltransferase Ste14
MTIRSRKFSKTTNRATLDQRIDQAIIWITVLALVALPLFFSFFNFVSVFNEPKVVMLHLTAGLIAILWLWQIVLNLTNHLSTNDNVGSARMDRE